jgi:hypothetical protein
MAHWERPFAAAALWSAAFLYFSSANSQSFTADQTINMMFETTVEQARQKLLRNRYMSPSDVNDSITYYQMQLETQYGDHYEFGTAGFPQDYRKALEWYLKSAAGAPPCEPGLHSTGWVAEFRIGRLYAEGKGVTRDPIQARAWMQKVACAIPEAQAWLHDAFPTPPSGPPQQSQVPTRSTANTPHDLPVGDRERRCQGPCEGSKSQCESANTTNNLVGAMTGTYNPFSLGDIVGHSVTQRDCSEVYRSCLRSCEARNN